MSDIKTILPERAWGRLWRIFGLVNAASVAVSVIVTHTIMEVFSAGINLQGLAVAIVTPLLLGGPMLFVLLLKYEQLRHANAQLRLMASTDWLTQCLNRGAFTHRVTTALAGAPKRGALLIIDADEFKSVNDRFGHDSGDDALRLMAGAIRAVAPPDALVGRLGGEEFGIFLPGGGSADAAGVTWDLQHAIAAIDFRPLGQPCPLSVSVGSATSAERGDLAGLYRLADQRLYGAKARTNKVSAAPVATPEPTTAAAA